METNWYKPNNRSGNRTAKQIGTQAEKFSRRFIRRQGLKLIATNVSYPFGEIDLIAEQGSELVFIEVRFRANASHGSAAETVNNRKQQRLILAAKAWLRDNQTYQNHYCRFDVIAIDSIIDTEHTDWQKNAFQIQE